MGITCILLMFVVFIMIPAIFSIIGVWGDEIGKGIKISITCSLLISVASFICAFFRLPFTLNENGIIGVIASIIGIPVAIIVGWNIYSAIDVKSVKKDYDKFKIDLEQENKENLGRFKNELSEENKSLKETIKSMQEQIKEIDVFGGNKGKCSVFTINSQTSEEKVNDIVNRITSYYNDIGITADLFMKTKSENNGKLSLTFKNGGISPFYSNQIKKQLKDDFNLDELTINVKDSWFSGSGMLIKRGDNFYIE